MAMAPSGEICIVEDEDGRFWLISIYAPNKQIAAESVDPMVAHTGWVTVRRTFDSWGELCNYRRSAYADYSAADARAAIRDTETAEGRDEVAAARRMLLKIIDQSPVVLADRQLYAQVVARLGARDAISAPERVAGIGEV